MAHRGDHVISRKAIAQGMSDVLRFTCMLMRALFVHIAHEIAGAARIRHSLRPLTIEGEEISYKTRAHRAARMRTHIQLSSSGLTGRPSIPETPMIEPKSRGVLDTRLRGYDSSVLGRTIHV